MAWASNTVQLFHLALRLFVFLTLALIVSITIALTWGDRTSNDIITTFRSKNGVVYPINIRDSGRDLSAVLWGSRCYEERPVMQEGNATVHHYEPRSFSEIFEFRDTKFADAIIRIRQCH